MCLFDLLEESSAPAAPTFIVVVVFVENERDAAAAARYEDCKRHDGGDRDDVRRG